MVDCGEDVDGPSASLVDVVSQVKVHVCRVATFGVNCF